MGQESFRCLVPVSSAYASMRETRIVKPLQFQNISDLLTEDVILPKLAVKSRKQVLLKMSNVIASANDLDLQETFNAIVERERLGSTAIGDGVLIPHARVEGLTDVCGAFASLAEPIDFDAIDDRPCDLVFMLIAPMNAGADHLRALARVSRAINHAETRQALRDALTPEAVLDVLRDDTVESDAA